ncbi:hypothetical protein H6G00_27760 [Leptolyngbya sp. FACHB-541]|uniref:hypothetical protein n=1 Tax=Leptolyngbya sp. FACHB-541 TaxID=2692810 RepID=UPI001687D8B3|nr:hypothetical protein [Leptolyngbya sp. FACHB-541]MBD2000354.1 hypothetical protein [Leptolyngbya sp. FACHB-541]
MRVSTTAFYTLAALIAGDLTQQAIAKPVSTATPERPEASDIESAAELSLPSSINAVTPPEQLQAIAFAEAVLTQYSEEYTRELTGVSIEDAAVAVSADSSPTEAEFAAIEVLATMPAPEIMGVEHSAHYSAYYLDNSAESFEVDPQADSLADLLVEDKASSTEELAFDLASFSTYQEAAVAPPEAITTPERMAEFVPKAIEAIATPEFFMPERSEQLFNDIEAPVNVLLPTTLSSESTQTYALNDLEEDEDLWIQAMIEAEFAEQAPSVDWVAVDPAFEVMQA